MNAFDTMVVDSVCNRAVEYSREYLAALEAKKYVQADIICYQISGLAMLTENYMSGKESSSNHIGGMQ